MPYDLQLGHCLDLIPNLADNSVDCVITSPPFYGQDYDIPLMPEFGRLGHETSAEGYIEHLVEIIDAMKPKLTREALMWVIVGDAHNAIGQLQGIPQRIAEDCALSWAYTMYWVLDSVYVPKGTVPFGPVTATIPILGLCLEPDYHYWLEGHTMPDYLAYSAPNPKDGEEFQTLPPDLVGDLLDASCPSGGTVVDPMCGAGNVIAIGNARGCYAIGMDLSKKAIRQSKRRVRQVKEMVMNELRARQQRTGPMPKVSGN